MEGLEGNEQEGLDTSNSETNQKTAVSKTQPSGQTSTPILILLAVAFVSHIYNLFSYPIYLGDEGIYMEQAWAVLRLGKLAPYTYFYDHAPAGWLLIAGWIYLLPGKFHQFGMAINSGRVLMVLIHVASVYLLYKSAIRMSGSFIAAFIASLIFTLSPLGLYYQRMVLLDNIMVFWLLFSIYFLVHNSGRLINMVASGLLFGLALLTKENAIFFLPVLAYMVYVDVKDTYRFRFAVTSWLFAWSALLSIYPLYALLKSELLPGGTSFILTGTPAEHVSLIQTWLWQLTRRNSSILDLNSQFWVFFNLRWWPRDAFIIGGGIFSLLVNLWLGLDPKKRYRHGLYASLLALGYAFYIIRGSVMLEFYLTPLLPFFALNIGFLADRLFERFPKVAVAPLFVAGTLALSAAFIYTARDHHTLNITQVQAAQLQWIRENIPASAVLALDDDLWVDLHEPTNRSPLFRNAHSHWKVQGDPDVRNKLLQDNWRNVDYVILSDDLLENMERENTETFVLTIIRNSRLVAQFQKGDVLVQVLQVNK